MPTGDGEWRIDPHGSLEWLSRDWCRFMDGEITAEELVRGPRTEEPVSETQKLYGGLEFTVDPSGRLNWYRAGPAERRWRAGLTTDEEFAEELRRELTPPCIAPASVDDPEKITPAMWAEADSWRLPPTPPRPRASPPLSDGTLETLCILETWDEMDAALLRRAEAVRVSVGRIRARRMARPARCRRSATPASGPDHRPA